MTHRSGQTAFHLAVDLTRELGVRLYASQHRLSIPAARACVKAIEWADTNEDRRAFEDILVAGERQLSLELGVLPETMVDWLDGGYDEPDAYPQLGHLKRVQQALHEA